MQSPTPARRAAVAAHADRVRSAGGVRTSVDLDAQAVDDLAFIRERIAGVRSTSEAVRGALRIARNQLEASATLTGITGRIAP